MAGIERACYLIPSDGLLNLADILVENASHILSIKENESSFGVKVQSKDVFDIFVAILGVLLGFLDRRQQIMSLPRVYSLP